MSLCVENIPFRNQQSPCFSLCSADILFYTVMCNLSCFLLLQTGTREEKATGVGKAAGKTERDRETKRRTKTENDGTERGRYKDVKRLI